MHILFLNSWYPSRVFPTNGDFVQRHAEAVSELHEVTSIHVVTDPDLKVNIEIEDVCINNVRTLIAYVKPANSKIIKLVRFFNAYLNLIKRVNKINFVHVNHIYPAGIIALYLKVTKGIKFLVTEHWTGFHNTSKLPWNSIDSFLMKIVARKASYMCPVTNNLAQAMLNLGLKGNYEPVPNVVNTDVFSVKQDFTNKKFSIIHVSNMNDNHKNISGLIRSISEFQKHVVQFELYMIGNHPISYKPYFETLGIEMTNIHFVHNISQDKLSEYMRLADVFVLFSNTENLPCVILESFSCGVPVISTDVGGIKEFFPNNFGHLIPVGDENALLEELLKIISKISKFDEPHVMHDYAVKHFNKKTIASQFSILYNQ